MTQEGVDFAWPGPSPDGLYSRGRRFVGRYLGAGGKSITQGEYDSLTRAGLSVYFYWEDGSGAASSGYSRGVSDAKRAQACLNALRGPSNQRPIYFTVDQDLSTASVRGYFQGVNSVIGKRRTGVYGPYRVILGLRSLGLVAFTCQTIAWSSGLTASGLNLKQYAVDTSSSPIYLAGGRVDLVRSYTSNYGQRAVILSKPAPSTVSVAKHAAIHDLQAYLKTHYSYPGAVDGVDGPATWKAAQHFLRDHYGYTGPLDGVPAVNTYKALQRLAQKGGYRGVVDGKPGVYTWRGVAAAL